MSLPVLTTSVATLRQDAGRLYCTSVSLRGTFFPTQFQIFLRPGKLAGSLPLAVLFDAVAAPSLLVGRFGIALADGELLSERHAPYEHGSCPRFGSSARSLVILAGVTPASLGVELNPIDSRHAA